MFIVEVTVGVPDADITTGTLVDITFVPHESIPVVKLNGVPKVPVHIAFFEETLQK